MDNDITAIVASWENYVFIFIVLKSMVPFVGVLVSMFDVIQSSLGIFLSNWSPSIMHVCFGYFTPFGVIKGVK